MARITVVAGTNGAGKSSIAGAMFLATGARYFNPDEVARQIFAANPGSSQFDANAAAWLEGKHLLERASATREDFVFETTLGGHTITTLLQSAIAAGLDVVVWYVALASPELHIERVRARVAKGGHDIAEREIRKRYDASRLNLIELLPGLAAVRVYDNSRDGDPTSGAREPRLLLHMVKHAIISHCELGTAPEWVKPILAAAFELDPKR